MARQLSSVRADIAALEKRRAQQSRELRACAIREGAIPEIHDRLRLVRAERSDHLRQPGVRRRLRDRTGRRHRHQPQRVRRDRSPRNGDLASAPPADVEAHRADYQRSLTARRELAFEVRRDGRRPVVVLAPQIRDDELDEQIAAYLKSTQEWDAPDGVPQPSATSCERNGARRCSNRNIEA